MQGRYGNDKLNRLLIGIALVISLVSLFIRHPVVKLTLLLISYLFLGYAVFRMLSRNTYSRYLENRKYLRFWERLRDRDRKYFDCPRCRQPVRVPRGKGKIAITCPKMPGEIHPQNLINGKIYRWQKGRTSVIMARKR